MPDTKTSALTAKTSLASGDLLYLSSGGNDRSIDVDNFSETGTFTPTIYGATTAGSHTYSQQNGHFCRVGKMVQFSIFLQLTSKDVAMSGSIRFSGLPYACTGSNAYTPASIAWVQNLTLTSDYDLMAYIQAGSTYINLQESNGASLADITDADIANDTQIMISGCYQAA